MDDNEWIPKVGDKVQHPTTLDWTIGTVSAVDPKWSQAQIQETQSWYDLCDLTPADQVWR